MRRLAKIVASLALIAGCASKKAKPEQALYIIPAAYATIVGHELAHAAAARAGGADEIELKPYPHYEKNLGWVLGSTHIGDPEELNGTEQRWMLAAGPLYDEFSGRLLNELLRADLVPDHGKPFVASLALSKDFSTYFKLFGAPFGSENSDLARLSNYDGADHNGNRRSVRISPWAWFALGGVKAAIDGLLTHDTERNVRDILGLPRKREENRLGLSIGFDGETLAAALTYKLK